MSHAGPTSARQAQATAQPAQYISGRHGAHSGLDLAHEAGFTGQPERGTTCCVCGAPVKVVAALQHGVLQRRRPSVAAIGRVAVPDAVGALLPAPRVLL